MGRCAIQIVMGPAGSGKSTYCRTMQEHASHSQRRLAVVNLDPAAEVFAYEPALDVRELISVEEVMQELGLGPNGGLLYAMEYLLQHMDEWLSDALEDYTEEDTVLLDCPGQLELYTHVPIMRTMIDRLRADYEGCLVAVFCIDAGFLIDTEKYLSGCLLSLSCMIALELPHVNVLTKCDLMDEAEVERILDTASAEQVWARENDRQSLIDVDTGNDHQRRLEARRRRRHRLTDRIVEVLEDWQMVGFVPLNVGDEDSIAHVLAIVDHAIQFGEDLEVKGADGDDAVEVDDD